MDKKINFVFLGKINAPNGAATFFRNIIENKIFIEDDTTSVDFYYWKNTENNRVQQTKPNQKASLRGWLQKISHKNSLLSISVLYLFALRHAKRIVNTIEVKGYDNKWVFNDIFTAYYFLKKYPNEKDLYLILHNDGNPTKMIFETHLALKGSFLEKKIEKVAKRIIDKMKKIILLSPLSKQVLIAKYPDLNIALKSVVIENGAKIEIKQRKRKADDKIVGVLVGSISYRKGYDILVDCNNSSKLKNISLLCVGNIQDEDIVRNNKKDNLMFLGAKNSDEVGQLLADADFFMLCSRDEGMPISIIEAMQYKLPIFATAVGAIPEMITDGKEGILMKPNKDSILGVLENINSKKYNLQNMGKVSYDTYLEKFSIEKMLNKYKNELNEITRA